MSVSIGLDGDNPAGEVLRNIPRISHGAKEKTPPVPAANGGRKATFGEVMERVVSTLNQSHHTQTSREADGGAQAIYVGEGLPPSPRHWSKGFREESLLKCAN